MKKAVVNNIFNKTCMGILLAGAIVALTLTITRGQEKDAAVTTTPIEKILESYEAWAVSCDVLTMLADKSDVYSCALIQQITTDDQQEANSNKILLTTNISSPDENGSFAVFMSVPLGVRIDLGISIQIGDDEPWPFIYNTCVPTGCIATGRLQDKQMQAIAAGKEAIVRFGTSQGQALAITLSGDGLEKAIARIAELEGMIVQGTMQGGDK